MPDLSLGEIARRLGAELRGDPGHRIHGVAEPATAGVGEIVVFTGAAAGEHHADCAATAAVVCRPLDRLPCAQLVCENPRRALGLLLEIFAPTPSPGPVGVDPRAAVDDTAEVDPDAWIGPFTYVGARATVGPGSRVEPFSYVGRDARVGRDSVLGPGVTLLDGCAVGDGVVLGPGAVVGHHGFGYWQDEDGWHRVPSRGTVSIDNGAELGANTCVDRGTLGATSVGQGVKIDNLVQVGHNSVIHQRALLCGQVGLAGSVQLDPGVILAGQVGVADHRRVGEGARVGAGSGVAQDVPAGQDVSGYPAIDHGRWLRSAAVFPRLGELMGRIRKLERQVEELTERGEDEN